MVEQRTLTPLVLVRIQVPQRFADIGVCYRFIGCDNRFNFIAAIARLNVNFAHGGFL